MRALSSTRRSVHIYALTDPRNGETRYVGATSKTLRERLRAHWDARSRNRARLAWVYELRSLGVKPEITELEIVPPDQDWGEAEQFWIGYLRFIGCDLLNATDGGDGVPGRRCSADSRRKLSVTLSAKGLQPHHLRALTAAFAKKASLRAEGKGYRPTPEHVAKRKASRLARNPQSYKEMSARGNAMQKANAKMSLSQKATARERFAAGGISQAMLAREYGVHPSYISRVVRGIDIW